MLSAIPFDWMSWNFEIRDRNEIVATIKPSWFSESSDIEIGPDSYKAYREGLLDGAFLFELNDTLIAKAEKPSAFNRSFEIEHQDQFYTLEAESLLSKDFILYRGANEIGRITADSTFSHEASIDLPDNIDLPIKVFMFWLVILLWKRAASSSGSS